MENSLWLRQLRVSSHRKYQNWVNLSYGIAVSFLQLLILSMSSKDRQMFPCNHFQQFNYDLMKITWYFNWFPTIANELIWILHAVLIWFDSVWRDAIGHNFNDQGSQDRDFKQNLYVSLRLRVQNAGPAEPCVGKYWISLILLNFLHCNFRIWFKTP